MIAERPADEKTTSNRYRCAAPGNGAVQAADKRSPLDEIMLDFALSSNKGPYHPDDLTNAVHYVIGTYPYPHTLTDDDTWALETNHQMLKMFPQLNTIIHI
jgi:hypothetical protein